MYVRIYVQWELTYLNFRYPNTLVTLGKATHTYYFQQQEVAFSCLNGQYWVI